MTKNELKLKKRIKEIRIIIARYVGGEGCSCCESDGHKDVKKELGRILRIPKYSDGSGYDFRSLLKRR